MLLWVSVNDVTYEIIKYFCCIDDSMASLTFSENNDRSFYYDMVMDPGNNDDPTNL